ncbi:MAG TPA: bifunctional adenosylcobinamide kinase/adenosylcobinamide-phosphate guanylyltransferase [Actinomycetales bacterium]|nr:bifunctional adenosylcobinamide kinase/adenosylcobinamide-phosphate guanylyltransferase [Actinomycetales bacterium]
MEVVLLGTGSADGWPNPFCRCASCEVQLAAGELRRPTAALVDDVLLLDCGTGVPAAALTHGRRLDRLRAVLLTHDHPDHSAPVALLAHTWARGGRTTVGRDRVLAEPLEVIGPAPVLESWRPWCGPDDPVTFRPVSAGDVIDVAGYRVRALAAEHPQPAVLYLVEDDVDGAGSRLLYATDTASLPETTVAAVADAPVDLLLLEETFGDKADHGTQHLDLTTFPRQLARLREAGGLRDGAQAVAVHLSHHNPPDAELDERLRPWGARAGRDGEVIRLAAAASAPVPVPSGRMATGQVASGQIPRRSLLLGGARSGKSTAAERLLLAEPSVTYVACGPAPDPSDPEWAERVDRHQRSRPASWTTVETTDLPAVLAKAETPVLVDCLGTWLTALLDRAGAWDSRDGWEEVVGSEVADLVAAWRRVTVPVVAVSNEVGSGVVPATPAGRLYRDWLGRLNQAVAAQSEAVLLVVAGQLLPLRSSGTRHDAPHPARDHAVVHEPVSHEHG